MEIGRIAEDWKGNLTAVSHAFSKVPEENHMTIRYEDLVIRPREVVSQLCAWLDVDYNEALLGFFTQNRDFQLEPVETLGWKAKTLAPIDSEGVGRHVLELTLSEIAEFESVAGDVLAQYMYHIHCGRNRGADAP
jgi:hypothetical protein